LFNDVLSKIDRYQEKNTEKSGINCTIEQMNLTNTYRIFHPSASKYIFLVAHGKFSKIDLILNHKVSLNKYMRTEIVFLH
jgi:hypothetical protein